MPFRIEPARTETDLDAAADLFRAYAASLEIDLAYQNFEAELASLRSKYAPPEGDILLAWDSEGRAVGCVALRPLPDEGCCEMKRLYVTPEGRGLGLGTALTNAVMELARRIGYREIRLDTLSTLTGAISIYLKLGFSTIPPYYDTPIENTVFMAKSL